MRFCDAAADLFLGSVCPGCARAGWGVCGTCRRLVESAPVGLATRTPAPPGYPITVAGGPYAGPLREMISAFKERQTLRLAPLLADRLALAAELLMLRHERASGYVLVPIPSTARAVRERGLDAVAMIARLAATRLRRRLGVAVRTRRMLAHARTVADQSELDAGQRWVNLSHSLRVRRTTRIGTWLAILVDDVTTTGATLAEGNRALLDSGVLVSGAAVVAATERRATARQSAIDILSNHRLIAGKHTATGLTSMYGA